jgi:S-DNA-T family DNA segregation ATPase FtsK/SpoIIIE
MTTGEGIPGRLVQMIGRAVLGREEAVELVIRTGQASISMLQRRLRVGYNRAARMIERMEKEGIVGPSDGVRPRPVLVRPDK